MFQLQWAQVSPFRATHFSESVRSKGGSGVEGYVALGPRDVPAPILAAANANGWAHFGKLEAIPDVFITGSNIATRRRVAEAVVQSSRGAPGILRPSRSHCCSAMGKPLERPQR